MALLGMLCRLWRCPAPGPRRREGTAEDTEANSPDGNSSDDLTAIGGIGIATQNRLYRAGIKSYVELARASPEEVERILGKRARRPVIEDWIAQADELSKGQNA